MTTTTTLDLGACPSCGAPRHLGDDPARPGRPAVVTDHRPGCTPALPVAGHTCRHHWVALPSPPDFPQVWQIERCRTCGTAHVVRCEFPAPKEITMTDRPGYRAATIDDKLAAIALVEATRRRDSDALDALGREISQPVARALAALASVLTRALAETTGNTDAQILDIARRDVLNINTDTQEDQP